jgi:hypothetical protein
MTRPLAWIGALTLIGSTAGFASIVTTPAGLAPGSTYQLVFVTTDGFFATSTAISDYNTNVTNEAALNATLAAFDTANGVTWTVIGSTPTLDATTNAPSSGAVYTLDGTQIASAANPLYAGSLLAPIDINQNGVTESTTVWTGSTTSGTVAGGINDLGQDFPEYGSSTLTNGGWITELNGTDSDNNKPLYALSSVITVPGTSSAVPEPASVTLVAGAMFLLAGLNRLRSRRSVN